MAAQTGRDTDCDLFGAESESLAMLTPFVGRYVPAFTVDPVVDHTNPFTGSYRDTLDELARVVGDGDGPLGEVAGEPGPRTEGLLFVEAMGSVDARDRVNLHGPRGRLAVQVGVYEVRVHQVGLLAPDLPGEAGQQERVQIRSGWDAGRL